MQPNISLPFKSTAIALLFTLVFGPVGLLYSSFWGGVAMIALGVVIVSSQFLYPIVLLWLVCCIYGVGAVERHNKKIINMAMPHHAQSNS